MRPEDALISRVQGVTKPSAIVLWAFRAGREAALAAGRDDSLIPTNEYNTDPTATVSNGERS